MVTGDKNPKDLVAESYNRIAERHAVWAGETRIAERQRYGELVLDLLPAGTAVLELGCGVGAPTTRLLATKLQVTGVDIAARHVELARQNVPQASFFMADMTQLAFAPASFDGVVAFYSIIHVPQAEQPGLFHDIARWLKPGGYLVCSLSAAATAAGYEADWLGAPMFWSGFDSATNQKLIRESGLEIVQAREETAVEDGEPVTFLWVVARKPLETTRGQPQTDI